jgi:hypothetical protein
VPDALWKHEGLDEGAKLLWCYLRVVRSADPFTFRSLREAVGICQNSLLKHLRRLEGAGWLEWIRVSRHRLTCKPKWRGGGPTLLLSTDILFDNRLCDPARWLWGVIERLGTSFTYETLEKNTGFCRESLIKYLGQLTKHGWFSGVTSRVARKIAFAPGVLNPLELKRNQELLELGRKMDAARIRPGYSLGQYLMAKMVQFLSKSDILLENAALIDMDNPETGGRLLYDLYLPEHRLAIEFNGRQHYQVTDRFPSQEALESQQQRDRLKAMLSVDMGIHLLVIQPEDLCFARLQELLAPFLTLTTDTHGRWHIYDKLARAAEAYRKKMAV